jgi:hypothetical protein
MRVLCTLLWLPSALKTHVLQTHKPSPDVCPAMQAVSPELPLGYSQILASMVASHSMGRSVLATALVKRIFHCLGSVVIACPHSNDGPRESVNKAVYDNLVSYEP